VHLVGAPDVRARYNSRVVGDAEELSQVTTHCVRLLENEQMARSGQAATVCSWRSLAR
jgi:hypothetical protein